MPEQHRSQCGIGICDRSDCFDVFLSVQNEFYVKVNFSPLLFLIFNIQYYLKIKLKDDLYW